MFDALNGMSAETRAALIGIAGVVIGSVLQFILQRWGKVSIKTFEWQLTFYLRDASGGFARAKSPSDAERAECSVVIQAFNSKSMPSGLSQPSLVFMKGKEVVLTAFLHVPSTAQAAHEINFPSGQFTSQQLGALFSQADVAKILQADRVYFRAVKPRAWWGTRKLVAGLKEGVTQ